MRLTPKQRATLFAELRLREQLTIKRICQRYGISRRTLVRLRTEMLEEHMAQIAPKPGAGAV